MAASEIHPIDSPDAFATAFAVSRETIAWLTTYEALLRRWQKTINLVAPSTLDDVWHRHFADSAQLWGLRPEVAATWLDLGSGAGFPGLVLAILAAERGGTRHILVESDTRKAAFVREVAREVGVAVDILCSRIESAETHFKVRTVDCVTARALAPLPRLLPLVAPYFASHTVGLFLKGRDVAAELDAATSEGWVFVAERRPSLTDKDGSILVLSRLRSKSLAK